MFRVRRNANKDVNSPNYMDAKITHQFSLTKSGERFLLYDSKEDFEKQYTEKMQRIIIFVSREVWSNNINVSDVFFKLFF